ncbi:MAG: FAD-binding protein [Bacteroidota bacterium]
MDKAKRSELKKILKNSEVVGDDSVLAMANLAAFKTLKSSQLIVRTKTVEDISRLVKYLSENKMTLYVVSNGKNWGFGSKVPVKNVDVLLELSAMDKIIAYDKEFGTVRVEPGVTFKQLSE